MITRRKLFPSLLLFTRINWEEAMANFSKIDEYIDAHLDESLAELSALCAQPSVSAQNWAKKLVSRRKASRPPNCSGLMSCKNTEAPQRVSPSARP